MKMREIKGQLEKLYEQYENLLALLDNTIKLQKKASLDDEDANAKREYLVQLKELLNEAKMLPLGDPYRKLIGDRLLLDFYLEHNDEFNAYMAAMLGEHLEIVQTFEAVVGNNDHSLIKETVEKIIQEKFLPAKLNREK